MDFRQLFLDLTGTTARRERRLEQAKEVADQRHREQEAHRLAVLERDIEIAHSSFTRMGLAFRPHGYDANDWIAPPVQFDKATNLLESNASSLIHMNLHPLACYRALGLSPIVDHWVSRVATEGWALLTDNFGPFRIIGPPRQWGHIEHPKFWEEVAKLLALHDTTGKETQGLLCHAGWAGNTVPFDALPRHQVEQYSASGQTCHPAVALWLKNQDLWNEDKLIPSMGVWNKEFPLAGNSFMGWNKESPITVAHVREWLNLMLLHYPLSQEQKVNLVGQTLLAFGQANWEHYFAPSAQAYVKDIDMSLLYAVCGFKSSLFDTFQPKQSKDTALEKTVALLTQDTYSPFSTDLIDLGRLQAVSNVHENLLLLLEIQPPQNRAELYMLADMARKMELGIIKAPETVALPDLSF